ncbi:MAG: caspase family protein [Chromatiaceae bacterium]|nr:caspase family protein [Chromatiaceae bacterium]
MKIKMTVFHKTIVASIYLSCFMLNANGSSSLALVIGNNNYEEVPKLQKAVNDANSISNKLAELGFEVVTTQNVSYKGMSRSLTELERKISVGDKIIFYFAGHGFAVDGTNYLLPVDVPKVGPSEESIVKDSSFAVSSISDRLRQKGAKTVIMILDACRDNPFALDGKRSIGQSRGLTRIDPAEGMFVLFSAGQGQAALDRLSDYDKDPNSIFTRTLLNELNNTSLSMIQIAKNTQVKVKNLAAKADHVQIPAYYDQVIGDLYLASPNNNISSLGKIEVLEKGIDKNHLPELDNGQSNDNDSNPIASFSNFSGRNGDGFDVMVSLPEPATQFGYRIGENGNFIDAGLTKEYDQETRKRKPKTEFSLPASQEETIIYVTWKDKRGEQSEVYQIPFDPDKELVNMQKNILEITDSSWVGLKETMGGGKKMFIGHLITNRCAIKSVHYGLNDGPLGSTYDLGPCNKDDIFSIPRELNDRISMDVPDTTTSIAVKLTYMDGTESAIRRYIVNGFAGGISSEPNSSNIGNTNLPLQEIEKEENPKEALNCNIGIKEYEKV